MRQGELRAAHPPAVRKMLILQTINIRSQQGRYQVGRYQQGRYQVGRHQVGSYQVGRYQQRRYHQETPLFLFFFQVRFTRNK